MKIYFNGKIITMREEGEICSAICINEDKIVAVGSDEEILKLQTEDCELIDLAGKTMTPGFIDPHSHYSVSMKLSTTVNLYPEPIGKVNSVEDLIEIMKEAITPDTEFLFGNGYDHEEFKEVRQLTKFDLDKVSTEIPVMAGHISGHVGTMNSKALEKFGYTSEASNPEGGVIKRIEGSNEPDGFVEENAWFLPMFHSLPPVNDETIKDIAKIGQDYYTQFGITTAQDGFPGNGEYDLYKKLADYDLLDIDVYGYPGCLVPNKWESGEFGVNLHDSLGNFHFAGYKMFLDGSPQARTAWLSKPYEVVSEEDKPDYVGYPIYTDEQVYEGISYAVKKKAQFLIHCNGDEASEQFLRVYEQVLKDIELDEDIRPVMVHCQLEREDQIDKMKELNILPTFFVAHTFYFGDTHILNFGMDRASKISNMRYAMDNGMSCTTHEDAPVVPPNVLFSIWAGVNRLTRTNVVLGEDLRITPYEGLKCYTVNGAYQYFEEDTRGTLEPGKLADLVIMDKNLLEVDPLEIKDIQVLETIKRGKTLFKK